MDMNIRKYKVGDKIPLDKIEVGDIIRFETEDQPTAVGMVHSISKPLSTGIKQLVFMDVYSCLLNYYPDQVTDAYVVMLRADINRVGTGEANKNYEGIKALRTVDKGTIFNVPVGRAQLGTRLIIKNGDDHWSQVDVYNKGHAEFRLVGDRDVVTQIWDKDHGVMDLLMPEDEK